MDSQLTSVNRKKNHTGQWLQIIVLLLFVPALIVLSWQGGGSGRLRPDWSSTASAANDAVEKEEKPVTEANPLPPLSDGPGGPVVVVSSQSNPFSLYPVEILRAEGLQGFSSEDISTLTLSRLEGKDVVVLGEMQLDEQQVNLFSQWVNRGGTLVAFRPCSQLLPLLGLQPAEGTLTDKYLRVHEDDEAAAGIVHETIQFHGTANLHKLNGAKAIASLYSSRLMNTGYPAVATMNVGKAGGRTIAFTYDLARSVVYTRQGNPLWAGQKRDGAIDPIRSDDLFFPDWLDFERVAIPQADEQQRLLANLITVSSRHRKPLPRLWYLPRDLKAAVVMTGDNHAANGTMSRFYQYMALGPNTAQDVADWKAIRATSYIYPDMPITNEQAAHFQELGFEISLHTNTGCSDYTLASLKRDFRDELARFALSYPGVAAPATNRSHCLNWSDWSSTPKVERSHNIRLDATYYYWPEAWMHNRPGMFTGSGFPMRFADMDGSLIDVYQLPTQMTDETNMNYAAFCNEVLDRALGPEGYYGVFCANMHTDHPKSEGADAIIASAVARGVPVISARQLLTWLDARNASSYRDLSWSANQLQFTATTHPEAYHLTMMLPLESEDGWLQKIFCDEQPVEFNRETIKGLNYAMFETKVGVHRYKAIYGKGKKMSMAEAVRKPAAPAEDLFFAEARPNPAIGNFNLLMSSRRTDSVTVNVFDASGALMERYPNLPSTGILRLGAPWKTGTYRVEATQGDRKKTLYLTKVK